MNDKRFRRWILAAAAIEALVLVPILIYAIFYN